MIAELAKNLGTEKSRQNSFFNMAAKVRQELPADIAELIYFCPDEWDGVRAYLK